MRFDALVIGAGAAGLMCALTAGRRGFSCALVDHSPVAGRKVRLAGGGKGNVTNRYIASEWYVGDQPGFPDRLLRRCSTAFVLDMLAEFGIGWEERDYGQLFCTTQAVRLVEALVDACRGSGARFFMNTPLGGIRHEDGLFIAETPQGGLEAPRLVIATGSPAWPSCGATDMGMRLARRWGHRVVPVRPVLVPFVCPDTWPLHGLAGVSLPAAVEVHGRAFSSSLLFRHKGLSGPAALQASCLWRPGETLHIDFLPGQSVPEIMHQPQWGKSTVLGLFKKLLPTRLAERLVPPALAGRHVAQTGKKEREALALGVHTHALVPTRTEGMGHAEAAAGGVDTTDINPRTLESRLCPGLYFAGEVLDVTGLLGGYNLHWAWASGKAAGESWKKETR